jgi:hypothetical protein
VAEQIAGLAGLTVGQLRERFGDVYGYPTNCRNKENLRKRVAWKIQADAEGGLSERALARIEELAPLAPVRWRNSGCVPMPQPGQGAPATGAAQTATPGNPSPAHSSNRRPRRPKPRRDPRLPRPGTILTRVHQGVEHRVKVMENGFVYEGQRYASLSKVARVIAGTRWSGFLFFQAALEEARRASLATE